jgi:predicted Fe-Mo cluster-binding NifX family protein
MLAQHEVDAVVVNGIGGRPLAGFAQIGVPVYAGGGGDVDSTLAAFSAGKLPLVGPGNVCPH